MQDAAPSPAPSHTHEKEKDVLKDRWFVVGIVSPSSRFGFRKGFLWFLGYCSAWFRSHICPWNGFFCNHPQDKSSIADILQQQSAKESVHSGESEVSKSPEVATPKCANAIERMCASEQPFTPSPVGLQTVPGHFRM